jgi:cytidylate kinase
MTDAVPQRLGPQGQPWIVAIDGAAGSGKSTLARGLAGRLDVAYVNTGAMYRALAAAALRDGIAPDDPERLLGLARDLRFILRVDPPGELEIEGFPPEALITLEVEATVSAVARHAQVRAHLRAAQRELGLVHGAVMEGRDIGAVVFADAPVKLYMVADPAERVERRIDERSGPDASVVEASMRTRDERDARTNPFEPAPGATVIDTTGLAIPETLDLAMRVVRETAPWMVP